MARAVQRFEVSLKAFVLDRGRALFLRERDTGYWELPGGRIDVGEERQAHAGILARELAEELGDGVEVAFADGTVTWTRAHPGEDRHVFLVARLGRLVRGAPVLSEEHAELAWLGPGEWRGLTFPPDSGYVAAVEALWQLAERAYGTRGTPFPG